MCVGVLSNFILINEDIKDNEVNEVTKGQLLYLHRTIVKISDNID